ncbi:hypothetical protein K443DRAFT_109718 [Laccaria amethystina LaAM-08-1]|uniref:Unplaced genomic scaffold K443scaffold_241, whole genome shotgun sequence n=1 Tax=Laccaria amethystina LaAM-08-1 TaxID=1095629 RepID=A0A0C9X0Q8_9AGAR|nr:hypothetical protein K443DRAFT_109718 [Laccaria amethystina LaAM-08-1]
MIFLPLPTPAAVWCSVLRADPVLWPFPLTSQHSAAPPTARPNDNHPAVMRQGCLARPKNITTYDRGRNEYDQRSKVLPIEASNAGSTARAEGNQDHPCDPHHSSSPSVGPCPPTTYETQPALVRISEEDGSERGEKECEGRRRWMTGGGARMASREMRVARSRLDDGERASYVCSSFVI